MFAGQRPPVATKFEHIRLIDNSPASVGLAISAVAVWEGIEAWRGEQCNC